MQARLSRIPSGEAGTDATVREMARLVALGVENPSLRISALSIVRQAGASPSDPLAVASALFDWVRSNIDFMPDPVNVETVQDPTVTLDLRAGDCDDHAILVAALAMSLGIPARFNVTGNHANRFEHVWADLEVGGQWLSADTTETDHLGESVRTMAVVKTYDVKGEPMASLGLLENDLTAVTEEQLDRAVYNATMQSLNEGWTAGLICCNDLDEMKRLIRGGEASFSGTVAEGPALRALDTFQAAVRKSGAVSSRRSALGSLGDPITAAIAVTSAGNAVKNAVGSIFGGGGDGDKGYGFDRNGVAIDEQYAKVICGRGAVAGTTPEAIAEAMQVKCPWKPEWESAISRAEYDHAVFGTPLPQSAVDKVASVGAGLLDNPAVLFVGGLVGWKLIKKFL